MLKILYAADNRISSFYSLKRFLDTYNTFYNIKTAAYSKSIKNINVNWNLDSLLDFTGTYPGISFNNSNFALYAREIKRFKPDLIISDFELYTSYIGLELGIPVWQVSPILLYHGINKRTHLYKYYSGIFLKHLRVNNYIYFILNNSNKKLVLSHLGDVPNPPILEEGYQWVRPNYNLLDSQEPTISVPASTIHLADVYFSNKLSIPETDYKDPESIITSFYNHKYGLSVTSPNNAKQFELNINNNIIFLSQFLKEADI